ncbi:F-box/LRR-repeat/kelch-repeat protein At1g09650-like [Salvia hispanica]|uniref:F-box/LRR-repeat/kelch-repeat protein At1g09650-like n=1 Tax=Salvia hispanica TaxID=49212 RepID=UPI00200970EC|nr:F-box/LRR-repeat/kelch-repeat protein At1g09650-like [Salvia hispanica]
MRRDLFTNLPEELTIDILGRLPSEIIMNCKLVCKSWLDLIEGGKFVTSYTPKPCLGFTSEHMYTVYEDDASEPLFQISLNPPHVDCGYNSRCRVLIDSADGLLFVRDSDKNLFVVNPMTRDYVRLPPPSTTCRPCIFGFGVSKISRQYKILCGLEDSGSCHVYTLGGGGGGSWRSISAPSSPAGRIRPITLCDVAAFFNGNLHWTSKEEYWSICCFDLKTELFTVFFPPPLASNLEMHHEYRLCTLEGQLCLCECKGSGNIDIWRMNSYGDDNSWERAYTFDLKQRIAPIFGGLIFPLKVLDNGDLWFTVDRSLLYIYSINTESAVLHNPPQCSSRFNSDITTYTPSFLSLNAMGIPNVQSLRLRPRP